MKQNLGIIDRWIRVLLGVGLLALTVIGPRSAWGYLGLLPLFTGISGSCLVYSLFGWSTRNPSPSATA